MPCRHIQGVEVSHHSSLTSVLDEDEWSASRPGRFTLRKETPVVTGECISSEVGLDVTEKKKNLYPCLHLNPEPLAGKLVNTQKLTGLSKLTVLVTGITLTDIWRLWPCRSAISVTVSVTAWRLLPPNEVLCGFSQKSLKKLSSLKIWKTIVT